MWLEMKSKAPCLPSFKSFSLLLRHCRDALRTVSSSAHEQNYVLVPFSPPGPLGLFLKLPNKTTSLGHENGVGPFSSLRIDPWRWPKDRSSGDEKLLWPPPKRITLVRRC